MSIKILKASDPVKVDTVTILVYGDPGAGKTSLAFSADSPLLLDFDRGAHRSAFRGDSVPISAWSEVEDLSESDLEPYRTICVDTAGRCLDALAVEIARENPKLRQGAGQLTLQGWGALKGRFAAWARHIRSFGRDLVLIAHGTESRSGDDLILRPDMQGGSYNEIFKLADGVAYLVMRDKRRMLSWDPSERKVGKNPAALPEIEVPHLSQEPRFLASLIAEIKSSIGRISEAGKAVQEEVGKWREDVEAAGTAKALTGLVAEVNSGDLDPPVVAQVKGLIAKRAKDLGLAWDGEKFAKRDSTQRAAEPAEATT